jgi:hypothetical protein
MLTAPRWVSRSPQRNLLQVLVNVPINFCGNTVDVIAL